MQLVLTATDLRNLSFDREKDAEILFNNQRWHATYYLIGFAVECALKACVAKTIIAETFPDKDFAKEVFTHSLPDLMRNTAIAPEFQKEMKTNSALQVNWLTVASWKVDRRYDGTVTELEARQVFEAARGNDGVLPWVRRRWL